MPTWRRRMLRGASLSTLGALTVASLASGLLTGAFPLGRTASPPSIPVGAPSVPIAPSEVFAAWGPPAAHYRSVVGPFVNPSVQSGSPGALPIGHSVASPAPASTDPGSGQGGWTPMMHCSKMPRIMALQSSG